MKLSYLKEVPLQTLKKYIDENVEKYKLTSNEWIYEIFDGENPFLELNKEFPSFELITNEDKPEKTDIENVKILYSSLKNLTIIEATNENLWTSLAHNEFWSYMNYRLSLNKKTINSKLIENKFFFPAKNRKSFILHSLVRLWWTGYLVYDERRDDPFELLSIFSIDFQTKLLYLFSSNFSNNKKITLAFLSAIYDFEKNGVKIKRELFNEVVIYLNILGGTYILDYFEEDELKEKIINKINTLLLTID